MLKILPPFIKGSIAMVLFVLNAIFIPGALIFFALTRYLLPFDFWRRANNWVVQNVFTINWIRLNNLIMRLTADPKIDIKGEGVLRKKGHYFLICNHQSWIDILLLYKVFGGRIPMLVFFMKRQVLWSIPIIGWSCWAIGFPHMHRASKAYLKKHPDKKGQDLEMTKKFCQRYKKFPATITSFLEATRFTQHKKHNQHSPYKHLLKPKASSFAAVLSVMSESLQEIINVTLIYPAGKVGLWDFVCGKIDKVVVRYEVLPITDDLRIDYEKDRNARIYFQNWLNQLWEDKDNLIESNLIDESKK